MKNEDFTVVRQSMVDVNITLQQTNHDLTGSITNLKAQLHKAEELVNISNIILYRNTLVRAPCAYNGKHFIKNGNNHGNGVDISVFFQL